MIDAIGGTIPAILAATFFWFKFQVNPANIVKTAERKITENVYHEYGLILEEYEELKKERTECTKQIEYLHGKVEKISAKLKQESSKIDSFSIDISLVEK